MMRLLSLLSVLTTICILFSCLLGLALIWLPTETHSEAVGRLLWSFVILAVAGGFIIAVYDAVARTTLAGDKRSAEAGSTTTTRSSDRPA